MRKFYGDEIGKVMGSEYNARSQPNPSIEVRFPNAEKTSGPTKAVAPPAKKSSLADLRKQAGG